MDQLRNKLSVEVYNSLLKANLKSLRTILMLTKSELAEITRLDISDVETINRESANVLLISKLHAANQLSDLPTISTGCSSIDKVMKGGITVNGITEICGTSGVGKTQICLQLSLVAQLPLRFGGFGKKVVYICTEDVFPIRRLIQLTHSFHTKFKDYTIPFEDNVFIEHASDFEQLRRCLFVCLPKLLTVKEIGLVVIDSIAGVFRSENFEVSYVNRSQDFIALVSKLNKLSTKYSFAVVCVNQMTDNISTGNSEPCLGLAWSNLVTSRFKVSRHLQNQVREFEAVFAPDLPNKCCKFKIVEEGVVEA